VTDDLRGFVGLIERLVERIDRLETQLAELRAPEEYLSTDAAAQLAGVHADTVRRWIREGKLEEHRAGRLVRVRRSDVERLLREGRRRRDDASPEELAVRDFGKRR
jgi:excisionase family DNA binding protein